MLDTLEALPYYRWHWRDYRANRKVQRMSWQARGLYRELLDEFWAEGPLPDDMASLAEICGCSGPELAQHWPEIEPCWQKNEEGRLVNRKMEAQRTDKDAERVKRRAAGSRGGTAKAIGIREAVASANHVPEPVQHVTYSTSSSKSSSRSNISTVNPSHSADAEAERAIYDAYPKHVAVSEALKAIAKAVSRIRVGEGGGSLCSATEARQRLLNAVQAYATPPP